MGRRPSGELRVVFDLSRPIRAKSFIAAPNDQYGYRLVIDFGSTASDETPVKAEHARPEARDLIIAIDAGHGGEDPGAIGKNGTREKDVVLAIARALAQRVDAEPGMKAVLTRNGDYFVPLRDRMRRARAQQADLFVSIHADSIRDRSVDGSSVYILSQRGATDEASRWLAERENASDLIGGVSLDDKGDVLASVLLDLSQSASLSASEAAAEHVLHQLNQVGEIRKPLVQQARFVVLKSPDIPSMLVETAYISNPAGGAATARAGPAGQARRRHPPGIRDYFYADPPAGTRIAQLAGGDAADRLDRRRRLRRLVSGRRPVSARGRCAKIRDSRGGPCQFKFLPTNSSTKSRPVRSSSGRPPWSRSWSRIPSTPARSASKWSSSGADAG